MSVRPDMPEVDPVGETESHKNNARAMRTVAVFLLTALYGAVLAIYGNTLSWLVVIGLAVATITVALVSLYFWVKSIGGKRAVRDYIHSNLVSSIAVIVVFFCLVFGTGIYLVVRPSRSTNTHTAEQPAPTTKSQPILPQSTPITLPQTPTVSINPTTPTIKPDIKFSPHVKTEKTTIAPPRNSAPSSPPAGLALAQPKGAPFSFPNIVCTSGAACVGQNSGTVIGTQNIYGPPPPQIVGLSKRVLNPVPPFQPIPNDPNRMVRAIEYNASLGAERASQQYTINPGLSLTFKVSPAFSDPDFRVGCDHPCQVTSISTSESSAGIYSSVPRLPSVLGKNQVVTITIRSLDANNPVTNADVEPNLQQ